MCSRSPSVLNLTAHVSPFCSITPCNCCRLISDFKNIYIAETIYHDDKYIVFPVAFSPVFHQLNAFDVTVGISAVLFFFLAVT